MPSVINLFSNNTATASGSVQVNVNKDAADKIADALSDKTNQGAATSSTDTDKLDKIANKLDEIASQSASVAQTPKPKEKSYRRLVDGILETTGYGEGLFGGLSASGSARATVRAQAIDKMGKLVLLMSVGASSSAFEFQQNPEDITESVYVARDDVHEETFMTDVTGTASPAVEIDFGKKLFILDPEQNVLKFASFPLIGGWLPSAEVVLATAKRVAFGVRIALLYLSGPTSDRGWYRWNDPKDQPPKPHQDWGALSTQFVDDSVDSIKHIPATGNATIAWFSITTTTGKQSLVDEKYAQSVR